MSSRIVVFEPQNARLKDLSLEQLLAELSKYAFVDIFNSDSDDTWTAISTMRIKTKGATFKISSGYNHVSAKSALTCLLELTLDAIKEMENASSKF